MLFTDGDIARTGDVDWKTALQIITVDLEHPGLGDSAAPVKRHFFRGRVKTQTRPALTNYLYNTTYENREIRGLLELARHKIATKSSLSAF